MQEGAVHFIKTIFQGGEDPRTALLNLAILKRTALRLHLKRKPLNSTKNKVYSFQDLLILALTTTGKRNIGNFFLSRLMQKIGSKKRSISPLEIGGLAADGRASIDSSKIVVLPGAKTTWSGYIEVLDRKDRVLGYFSLGGFKE
jgi:hypothetical protein